MTYIKIIFVLIIALLDRCGIIRRPAPLPEKEVVYKAPEINPEGTWRLSDMNGELPEENPLSAATLYSFFPDSTFSEVKSSGEFAAGAWSYNKVDSSLTIKKEKITLTYHVWAGRDGDGVKVLMLTQPDNSSLELGAFGKKLDVYKEDPFYPANNTWRNRPAKAECKQEVLSRLRGYLLHSAYLFKAADTRKQSIISWEFSKGILKIYRSGIGVVKQKSVPGEWISYFHSEEDALLAHTILEDFFMTTTYKGEATGNWVKDDYDILISTYERLKTRNLASIKTGTKKESR
ncbi:hypothetical protein DSL64_26170 [Dyadobacter luteus]|uniref:Uncharacterized protein n=1 Tax=Dyadobacter luteus TaxID=2259619 RepID=A0A3D8Y3K8_9BACT|nr:hypothetical protein [Dyadobacter luteus]REA56612.1 hypothetical protein DSL64_26170 [Dyadobacter luteus]